MALFSLKPDPTFGLDIDETSIKIVQLRREEQGYAVTGAARSDLDAGSTDEMVDPKAITIQTLRQSLSDSGISSRQAVAAIGGESVSLRCFQFPTLDKKELAQAILLDAEQSCPFDMETSVVDYHIHTATNSQQALDEKQVKGVMVAAKKDAVNQKHQLIQDAGLNCVLMDVDDLALLNCFHETESLDANQSAIILNIGSSMSHLIIVRHGCDPFFRNISHGQDQFIKNLAAEHEDSPQTILKFLFDPQALGNPELNLAVSLARFCQPLISDVMETIRYYYTQHKVDSLDRMLVCGNFSRATPFIEFLGVHLPFPVERWNPLTQMRYDTSSSLSDLLDRCGSALVVAAGLAMRTL